MLAETVSISGEALLIGLAILVVGVVLVSALCAGLVWLGASAVRKMAADPGGYDRGRPIGRPLHAVCTVAAMATALVFPPIPLLAAPLLGAIAAAATASPTAGG